MLSFKQNPYTKVCQPILSLTKKGLNFFFFFKFLHLFIWSHLCKVSGNKLKHLLIYKMQCVALDIFCISLLCFSISSEEFMRETRVNYSSCCRLLVIQWTCELSHLDLLKHSVVDAL